jgi:predicted small lipoprotein YifL
MKKILVILLALITVFGITACGKTETPAPSQPDETAQPSGEEATEGETYGAYMANPWQDCNTLEDAAKVAGFEIAVPDRIEGYPQIVITAMEKKMIQVYYGNGSFDYDKAQDVTIRKGIGNEDISGDYNEYSKKITQTMHGVDVTLKGNTDGVFNNASWYQGGYAYSILATEGLSAQQIENMVELVK